MFRGLSVAVFVVVAGVTVSAGAQQPVTVASGAPADKAPPAINADMFKLPAATLDSNKFDYTPPPSDASSFNPGRFSLGSSVLQLDTRRKVPNNRVGIETVDPKLLGNIQKNDTALPNYFGMTLTKPLN